MFRGIKKIAAEIAAFRWWYIAFALCAGVTAKLFTDNTLVVAAAAVSVPLVIVICVTSEMTLWMMTKFVMLFAAIAGFVSYNFGMIIGLPVAIAVTALAVAQRKIFDAASDAFFDVHTEDDGVEKAKKTASTVFMRVLYTMLDYGLAIVSIGLVVGAKEYGFSYTAALVAMWVVIDFPSAAFSVVLYEKTGRDITLGRSYRRMVNVIFERSRLAGGIYFLYEATMASFWSGPDYAVLFFRDELKTRMRMTVALVVVTLVHAVLWTTVYWYGYENISDLWRYIRGYW